MKKIITIIIFMSVAFIGNAQLRYNFPLELGVGYSRPMVRDWSGSDKVHDFAKGRYSMLELYLCGVYAAMSNEITTSLPDDSFEVRSMWRAGIELGRLNWGDGWWLQSIALTPFYSFNNYRHGSERIQGGEWGMKFDYAFSIVDLSLLASKQEITVGVSIIFPFYTVLNR